jgi:hypothetical protein
MIGTFGGIMFISACPEQTGIFMSVAFIGDRRHFEVHACVRRDKHSNRADHTSTGENKKMLKTIGKGYLEG